MPVTAFLILASALSSAQPAAGTQPDEARPPEDAVYVNQTRSDNAADGSSEKVYLLSAPLPSQNSRQPDAGSLQIEQPRGGSPRDISQLSEESGETASAADQLTRERGRRALAQLTERDREILLRAVSGTDICDRQPSNPAVIELCLLRLENRSDEFAVDRAPKLSPEERLLGEGLDSDRVASLESAISRLARGTSSFESDEDQAIASVALGNSALAPAQPAGEEPNESDLSAETQALINAIVEQFSQPGGGGQ